MWLPATPSALVTFCVASSKVILVRFVRAPASPPALALPRLDPDPEPFALAALAAALAASAATPPSDRFSFSALSPLPPLLVRSGLRGSPLAFRGRVRCWLLVLCCVGARLTILQDMQLPCQQTVGLAELLQGSVCRGMTGRAAGIVPGAPAHLEGVPQHALPLLAGAQHSKGVHLGALLVLEVDLVPVQRLPSDSSQVLLQTTMNVIRGCPVIQKHTALPGHGTLKICQRRSPGRCRS